MGDASVMFRRWKESKGKDKEYENIIRKQVQLSKAEAEKDNVVVPTTMEEYCMKPKPRSSVGGGVGGNGGVDNIEMDDDFYDDCYDLDDDDDDDDDDEDDEEGDDEDDSGNESRND